jgi:hypothetical protein
VCPRRILKHPFDHQLGAPIWVYRGKRDGFVDRGDWGLAINRRGRGKDKMFDFSAHRAFKQIARLGDVVEIVGQRIADRFGYHDFGGEMGDGVNLMFGENCVHERRVANIAENEFGSLRNRPTKSCRKIIENDNFFAGIEEGQHHMAADIACSACYKNRHAVTRT